MSRSIARSLASVNGIMEGYGECAGEMDDGVAGISVSMCSGCGRRADFIYCLRRTTSGVPFALAGC